MPYYQRRFKKETRWICFDCNRFNEPENEFCSYCRSPKPTKKETKEKGKPRYNVARRTEYDGRWYHSAKEAQYAGQLDLLKMAGEIKEWKPQHKIEIRVNGKKWRNYYVDFRVVTKHDTVQYHEVKGYSTAEFLMKWDLLVILKDEILEPGAELILIK